MGRQARKDREYKTLYSALTTLKKYEFAAFYGAWGNLQIRWNVFCTREKGREFHKWMGEQVKLLESRKVSYKVFKERLASYIQSISNPDTHEKLIELVREIFVTDTYEEFYEKARKMFRVGEYKNED